MQPKWSSFLGSSIFILHFCDVSNLIFIFPKTEKKSVKFTIGKKKKKTAKASQCYYKKIPNCF
jgi:hypothetical protein